MPVRYNFDKTSWSLLPREEVTPAREVRHDSYHCLGSKEPHKILSPNGELLLFAEKEVAKKSRAKFNCARWRSNMAGGTGNGCRYSQNVCDQGSSPSYPAAQRREFRGPSPRSNSKRIFSIGRRNSAVWGGRIFCAFIAR